jgi:hypothetical protein
MLKFLAVLILAFSLAACAGTMTTQPTAVAAAQNAAQQSLYAVGVALQATPAIVTALYNAAKINKDTYNSIVQDYNTTLAAYQLAVSALQAATTAGEDPNLAVGYVNALATFTTDKTNIDNLLTASGQKPIGAGVTQ